MSLFSRAGLQWYGLWWLLGWGWVALVWFLSLINTPIEIDVGTTFNDKIGHFIAYCWLMLWFGNLYSCRHARKVYGGVFISMGILLEILQGTMTELRQFSYGDMLANGSGVLCGYWLLRGPIAQVFSKIEHILKLKP